VLGSVGEDTKKATRGRTRGVVGRLTLGISHHAAPDAASPGRISEQNQLLQKHDVSKRQDTRPRTWEKGQGRMALQRGELRMKIRSIPKVRLRNAGRRE
jgi:hypothetical protein